MSNGKPMRAVICYDIEIDGGLSDAAKFEALLKDYSKGFESYLKENDPEIAKIVNFPKVQAEVPMQERRGETGSLSEIVFRGSRVKPVGDGIRKSIAGANGYMVLSSTPLEVHLKKWTGPNEGKEFVFPVEQLPFSIRKYFQNPGSMDGKVIPISKSRMGDFGIAK